MSIRKSLESTFSLTVAMYVAVIITFLYSIILVRMVSVDAFGMIGKGNTYIEIVMLLATIGSISIIQTYTTYYISRKKLGILKHILLKYSIIILVVGAIFSIITFFFSNDISLMLYKTDIMNIPLKVVSVFIMVNLLMNILSTIIKASKQYKLFGSINMISAGLNLILTIVIIDYVTNNVSSDDNIIVSASFIASITMAVICSIIILLKNRKNIRTIMRAKIKKTRSKRLIRFGITSASLVVISMWSLQINKIAVGYFLDPDQWGYFYIAVIIVSVILVFKTALNVIVYPSLVDAHSRRDYQEFDIIIHIIMKYWTLFVLPLILVFVLFLPYVIPVIWGTEYIEAVLTTQILLIGFAIQNYASIYSSALTAIEKPHKQFGPTLVYVLLNVVFSLIFVYYYGILGAALTILIANLINIAMNRHVFIRDRRIRKAGVNDRYMGKILKLLLVQITIIGLLFLNKFLRRKKT